jgi:hypothetical protein
MLDRKLRQIMPNAAANVYDQRSISIRSRPLYQAILYREERLIRLIHPAGPALTVATHVVIELLAHGRVRLHVSEHVQIGGVGVLVRAVGGGVGLAIGG